MNIKNIQQINLPEISDEKLLNEKEVAKILGVSVKMIQTMRYSKGGIPFVRLSKRCIRYKRSDVEAYIQSHTFNNTSQYSNQ